MSWDLLISYDLMRPGQNYHAVQTAIKRLGKWQQLQFSFFYVHTTLSPREAFNAVWAAMDANDRLAVTNAYGVILTEPETVINAINGVWYDAA